MKNNFLLIIFLSLNLFGQEQFKIDSLKKVLQSNPSNAVKSKSYLKLSKLIGVKDTTFYYINHAIKHAKLANETYVLYLSYSRKSNLIEMKSGTNAALVELKKVVPEFKNSEKNLVLMYYEISYKYDNISKNDSSFHYIDKGLKLAIKNNLQYLIALAYLKHGNRSFYMFDYKTAMKNYLKADSVCEKNDSLRTSYFHAKIYNYIGYSVRKPYGSKETLKYYLKAKSMHQKLNDNDGIQEVNIGLAELYCDEKKFTEALSLINEAVAYQKKIDGKAYSYSIITRGYIYLKMKRLNEAEKDYIDYYKIVLKEKDRKLEGKALGYLANLYKEKKEYTKASQYYTSALNFFDNKYDEKKRELYEEMIDLYSDSKDDKNLVKTYKEYLALRNKIEVENKNKDIFELETRYQTEKKEQQIKLLSTQNELAKKQKYIYIGLLGLLALIGGSLFYSYRNKIKTAQKLNELNDLKSRFFANISHEFRTPLTLIKSPVQSLQSEISDENQKNKLQLIDTNSTRMLQLVDQLLELSKIDSGNLKLFLKDGNINSFLTSIIEPFQFQAKEKGIDFTTNIQKTTANTAFDKDVIEKIVTNLVSNAFKYSPQNETITFASLVENSNLKLVVSNTGSDVKKEDLPKLFERFYQKNETQQGVGIGLALVKELVDLYKGTIATSVENGELAFVVNLPLAAANENAVVIPSKISSTNIENSIDGKTELPILLIVDDNADIRSVLKDIFKNDYQILEAQDGEEALILAQKEIPDCIISDVMMPKLDGFEFTKQIKNNELTSFIPVILLTAKTSDEAHLEGLKSTTDAFLTKPFNNEIIKATVSQLIAERKKLHERYSQELVLKPVDIVINSVEEKFIEKLQTILDKNLSNSGYTSEDFASEIGMSRMQLHRKLKSLLGVSSTEFLRNERLKVAAELLKQGNGNISDVAYAVGFNDVSYFSKCFKEMYDCTPSEIADSSNS